ncbi:MAG: PQQ-like beta-propeller repeat protein, partial [Bacteroidia bacterium]|nr:PQQ-like beta-propeller repeat protein [Bacteroidia bacterium]
MSTASNLQIWWSKLLVIEIKLVIFVLKKFAMLKKVFFYGLLFCVSILNSQTTFNNCLSSPVNDIAADVIQTNDGGYLYLGGTFNASNGGDVQLIKTLADGSIQWQKDYGAGYPISDVGECLAQTTDGGYLFGGSVVSLTGNDSYAFIIKVSSTGVVLWNRKFGTVGSNNASIVRSIQPTSDGGCIFTGGYGTSIGSYPLDVCLVKLDVNGNIQWHKAFNSSNNNNEWGRWIEKTSDGGYIIVGTGGSFSDQNLILIKTNSTGSVLWSKSFGGTLMDAGEMVKQTSDGGYVIIGTTSSFGNTIDTYVLKTDSNGNLTWSKVYRKNSGYPEPTSIFQTSDGGYIINGDGLIKINSVGDVVWQKSYTGDIKKSKPTTDGGTVVVGETSLFTSDVDKYMAKKDASGINCVSKSVSTSSKINITSTSNVYSLTSQSPIVLSSISINSTTTSHTFLSKCLCPANAGIDKSYNCSCCLNGCLGVSIGTPSSGYTYSWSPSDGLPTPNNLPVITVNPSNS